MIAIPRWCTNWIWLVAIIGCGSPGTQNDGDDTASEILGTDTNQDTDSTTDLDGGDDAGTGVDTDSVTISDTDSASDVTFDVVVSLSSVIGTVGIVTWSMDHAPVDEAFIEFGLDSTYGMKAPVNLGETNYRTLLLGMKPSRTYHFRITAVDGTQVFQSQDTTLETGPVTNFLPPTEVDIQQPDGWAGGFVIATTYNSSTLTNPITFIIDAEGDIVWWMEMPLSQTSSARMTFDGKYMAALRTNLQGTDGAIHIVTMDGLNAKTIPVTGAALDFTAAPEGGFAIMDISDGKGGRVNCARIMEVDLDGNSKEIFDTADVFGKDCHNNAIRYAPAWDAYTIGDIRNKSILHVSRSGKLNWILNGASSDFSGTTWIEQHGHQLLSYSLLVFENSSYEAVEYSLDFKKMTATKTLAYQSKDTTSVLGDVQRLPNGNTLVSYSLNGVFHEIDPSGQLLKRIAVPQMVLGYGEWRSTLYGPSETVNEPPSSNQR